MKCWSGDRQSEQALCHRRAELTTGAGYWVRRHLAVAAQRRRREQRQERLDVSLGGGIAAVQTLQRLYEPTRAFAAGRAFPARLSRVVLRLHRQGRLDAELARDANDPASPQHRPGAIQRAGSDRRVERLGREKSARGSADRDANQLDARSGQGRRSPPPVSPAAAPAARAARTRPKSTAPSSPARPPYPSRGTSRRRVRGCPADSPASRRC